MKTVGAIAVMPLLAMIAYSGVASTDYYWTGAAEAGAATTNFLTAGNWALEDGTIATTSPGATTTVIFTNDAPLKITWTTKTSLYGLRFHGASVDGSSPTSNRDLTLGAGGVVADGGGTYMLGWNLQLGNVDQIFDIAAGSTFVDVRQFKGTGVLHKRGAGTFKTKGGYARFLFGGTLLFEEGVIRDDNHDGAGRSTLAMSLCVTGSVEKTLYFYGAESFNTTGHFSVAPGAEDSVFKIKFETNNAMTFKLYGDQTDTTFNADLVNQGNNNEANRTFRWAPNDATTTLTYIRKNLNSTKWGIAVTNGIIKCADGMKITKLRSIAIERDGKFVLDRTAGSMAIGAPLTITDNGVLKAGEGVFSFSVPGVTVNGETIADGIYRASDVDWFEGDAILVVGTPVEPETTTATWVGGAADNSVLDASNWGGALPDLNSGSLVATFPASAAPMIPADKLVRFKGIVVEDGATTDTFAVSGSGALWLGSEGLKTATTGGKGRLTFANPIVFVADQTWQVGVTNAISFTETASLASLSDVTWTSRGAVDGTTKGTCGMRIACCNPHLGNSVLFHAVTVSADGALGGKAAYAIVNAVNRPGYGLTMENCTLSNDAIRVAYANNNAGNCSIYAKSGVCTFLGRADMYSLNADYWACAKGAQLNFFDGLISRCSSNAARSFTTKNDGYLVYVGGSAADMVKLTLSKTGEFHFETADNNIYRGVHLTASGAILHTSVAEAFRCGEAGTVGAVAAVKFGAAARWELHDCDQTLQILCGPGAGTIYSENAAVVTLRDDAVYKTTATRAEDGSTLAGDGQYTNNCAFAGGVSFAKVGPLTHYYGGNSSSTGSVEVTNGTLVMLPSASWGNASALRVSGSGHLTLASGKAFGKNVALEIADTASGAVIEIPAGQTMRCATLKVNGVVQQNGCYTGEGVTGGGVISVGKKGFVVLVM